jgi:probable phosphoglycerate mutase
VHAPTPGETSFGRVLLVRHGRTMANAADQLMGRADPDLDDIGREQATALAVCLAQQRIDAVFSSPLRRAMQTAEAIAHACKLDVQVSPELAEMDFGPIEATSGPRPKLKIKERHLYTPIPGGESLHDVWTRLTTLLATIEPQLAAGRCLVLVGHYRTNQLLEGRLRGWSFETSVHEATHKPANGSMHEVTLNRTDPV